MTLLSEIVEFNRQFVDAKEYEAFRTSRLPNKRLLIVSCMDTRLIELLPRAMGLGQGDMKVVKTAGAIVAHPFGSAMRSVIVGVYELDVAEVAVIGHHGCGMTGLNADRVLAKAAAAGVDPHDIETLNNAGIDLQKWLTGFESPEAGVRASVDRIRKHPLLPKGLPVHGLMMHPETGQVDVIEDGYAALAQDQERYATS